MGEKELNKRKPKSISEEAARLRMASLCARTEQCEYDIRMKLSRILPDPQACQRIISFLKENRFIDNERFAGAFARDKIRFSGWGPAKVRAALRLKRIDTELINQAIASVGEEEKTETLLRIAGTKAKQLDLNLYNDRLKLMRFLAGRGFDADDCRLALKLLKNNI